MPELFDYDNMIGRPPGPFLRIGAKFSSGIRQVQAHIPMYAESWLVSNAHQLKQDKPLWIVLGDSMAQGIGASSFLNGWAGQLQSRLRMSGRDYKLVNLSISGARTADVLDRQLPAMVALGIHPALVTMMIGSNNLARKQYRHEAREQFAEIIRQLPSGSVVANLPGNGSLQQSIAEQLEQARRAGKLVIADMRSGAPDSWHGKLAADHFHPNDAGYTILTNAFSRALVLPAVELS